MATKSEKEIFNSAEQHEISHAISLAENHTSGEIQVCVERLCEGDPFERAKYYFEKLGMDKTALKNGVLFYVAVDTRKFAIIGDSGIDLKVPENFWEETKDLMKSHFSNHQIVEGLLAGIDMAGQQLKHYFPVADDDINELPNEVIQF
jgi:uncharacterized membrane protein